MSDYDAPKGFGCFLAIHIALAACAVFCFGLLVGWMVFGGGA